MTSNKKLSIGAAIALVASLIVGLPSQANTQTLTVDSVSATGGTSSATAVALPVPATTSVVAANALKVAVSGLSANTTVSATATNALLLSTLSAATVASGSAALSVNTGSGSTAELFIFTKTAATGSVVVTVGNTTTTYYVVGVPGAVAKVTATAATTGLAGSTQSVIISAFDQYDNAKPSGSVSLLISTNGVITTTTVTTGASGTVSHVVTLPASGSVTVTAYAASSSSLVTIGVTQPRNLQDELDKALADLAAEKASHADTKAQLATAALELANVKLELAKAIASKTASATQIRKLKWQYNTLVKKYNVGKPKAQKLAFIK